MYISSPACISPQQTFSGGSFPHEIITYHKRYLNAIEPAYKNILDPKLSRRMSRIVRMGVAAALASLKDSGIPGPDAIIVGTSYGSLDDTGIFLTSCIQQLEQTLSPTAFMQSTHNIVSAQIALVTKCREYNNTFVHRGHSFESALLDGMMLLREGESKNVLVGSVDEITDASFAILDRFGLYKKEPVNNMSLIQSGSTGTIAGEGAAFFILSSGPSKNDHAHLDRLTTFYKPSSKEEVLKNVLSFISGQSIQTADIDLVITGRNGDEGNDEINNFLQKEVFINNSVIDYKHLCGEYPTAVSFAMFMASKILHSGKLSGDLGYGINKQIKKVLIYNNYQGIHHSLILLSAT